MKYGVLFPQNEIGNDPEVIKNFVQTVEGLGYEHLLIYEHVLGVNFDESQGVKPYTYEHAFHEPLVLFGYLAGLTQSIELVTAILVLPQRQTPLVAKQAVEVDLLSQGRVRLGVGVGWNDVEYAGMGVDFSERGKRIEAQVGLLRSLWSEPLVSFAGEFESIHEAGLNPLPARSIPIWMGGSAEVVLRRMAKMADGWFMHDGPVDAMRENIQRLHAYLEGEQRNPNTFGIDVRLILNRAPESQWADWVSQREQLGITHITVGPEGMGEKTPQAHLEAIRRFKSIIGF